MLILDTVKLGFVRARFYTSSVQRHQGSCVCNQYKRVESHLFVMGGPLIFGFFYQMIIFLIVEV
jgi:hypothetical protein